MLSPAPRSAVWLVWAVLATRPLGAQVTGLAGWDIFLDPGHSGINQNVGIFGYAEPHKNLRVALELRDLLLTTTDIDAVNLSRTNDQQQVSLSQRTDLANSIPASWFHSIHSNAGASTANNALMLYGEPKENPNLRNLPGGKAMSEIMVVHLANGMRIPSIGARGECQFYYGNPNCTSTRNHVNRVSNMPSELSEAGFHTHPVQNQRNMSARWKRLEAYTFYWSILQFYGIARPPVKIMTGIISDLESGVPVNGALAVAAGVRDTTDTYAGLFYRYSSDPEQLHNGFYFLEDVAGPSAELVVSAPDYYPDILQVALVDSFFTFRDVQLVSSVPPRLISSTPAEGDTSFPAWDPLVITFSRPMELVSVEGAFTAPGGVAGAVTWGNGNRRLTFTPASPLAYLTDYTLTISGQAEDAYGHLFDGDGDGVGGDGLTLSFRTGPADLSPPQAVEKYPAPGSTGLELQPIVSIAFDEELEAASVSSDAVWLVRSGDGFSVPGTLQHFAVAGRSVLNFFPSQQLRGSRRHTIWLNPGLRDLLGNETTTLRTFRFDTGDQSFDATGIDDFETELDDSGNWWEPSQSGSTDGILAGTDKGVDGTVINLLTSGARSLSISYQWDTLATTWLIREYLAGGAPRQVHFDDSYILQVYVFGDGGGNKFRFAVDDNNISGGTFDHEVSPWTTIDWIGWRLVSWDMFLDGTGIWLGDGNLDGTMRFDSIQLTHEPGSAASGTLYIDDLRLIQSRLFAVEDDPRALPGAFVLHPNYPNPFNSSTTISYEVPLRGPVELTIYDLLGRPVRTLVQATVEPGRYRALWDGHDEAGQPVVSGLYIARLQAGEISLARKLVLVK